MKHFIFDLYGTLIDIRTDEEDIRLYERMAVWYAYFGAVYKADELKETYFRMVREEQERIGGRWPEPDIGDVFVRILKEKSGNCENEVVWVKETARLCRSFSMRKLRLYDGVPELLSRLKKDGKGVWLLSNAQTLFTLPEIRKTGILPYFDGIFISSDHGIKKPDPAFMEKLLKTYNLPKEECVMIGNDFRTDIQSAYSSGMKSIFINSDGYTKIQLSRMCTGYNGTVEILESIKDMTEEEYYARLAA